MSAINIALIDASVKTAKPVMVTLPREATIAELHTLISSKTPLTFSVNGYTPSRAAVVGDLFDACGQDGKLEVLLSADGYMGGELTTTCLCLSVKAPLDLSKLF